MSHKHSFSLGGHSVTSHRGGHSQKDPYLQILRNWSNLTRMLFRFYERNIGGTFDSFC